MSDQPSRKTKLPKLAARLDPNDSSRKRVICSGVGCGYKLMDIDDDTDSPLPPDELGRPQRILEQPMGTVLKRDDGGLTTISFTVTMRASVAEAKSKARRDGRPLLEVEPRYRHEPEPGMWRMWSTFPAIIICPSCNVPNRLEADLLDVASTDHS